MSKDIDLEKGDVVAMPVDSHSWAIGQVIVPGKILYMGAVLKKFDNPTSDLISSERMTLFSWTTDGEVCRGNWKVLGNQPVAVDPYGLEYIVQIDGKLMVESFDTKRHRGYDGNRDASLAYRKDRSPLIIQDAVQAALGIGEWFPSYDQMLANTVD